MSQIFVAAPRSRSLLWIAVAAGIVGALLTALVARRSQSVPVAVPSQPIRCEPAAEPSPPPAPPTPGPDVYAALAECLRNWPETHVTVDDVRRFVEVEHDPTWFEAPGTWWLPLSGEGEANYPSGIYATITPAGPSVCQYAIVN